MILIWHIFVPEKSAESLQEHTAKVVERACWLIGKHGFGEGRRSFDSGDCRKILGECAGRVETDVYGGVCFS